MIRSGETSLRSGTANAPVCSRKGLVLAGFASALSAPEVAWSLIDAGFTPIFFARRGRPAPIRHIQGVSVWEITPPEVDSDSALRELSALVARYTSGLSDGGVLLPLDDASVWLCAQIKLSDSWKLAGPKDESRDLALNKWTQIQAAKAAGLSVPESQLAFRKDDFQHFAPGFPLIIRSANAVVIQGSRLGRGGNWICAERKDAEQAFQSWGDKGPLLVQPFIQGQGEGIFGLATADRVLALSSHRRLRMMNPHGSGSSACAAQPVPDEMREPVERFIRETGFTGIFMIELLRDQSGRRWFVEFNGRSWGSMALARRQGLEYPAWAVELATDPTFAPEVPAFSSTPVECRNLGREVMHLLFVLRGSKSRAIKTWPSVLGSIRDLLRFSQGSTWYNWRRSDWKVFFSDFFSTIRDQLGRKRSEPTSTRVAVACHIHSEWSYDAKWTLPALAATFAKRGYRVLMMTEHDRGFTEEKWQAYRVACETATTPEVLVVPGMEYSDPSNTIHILVWGCREFLGENLPTMELLQRVQKRGGVAVMAHPARRSAWEHFDPAWVPFLLGIEIWNRKTDGWAPSRVALPLLESAKLRSFAGLDFHDRRQFFPLSMQCRIDGELTGDALVDSFRAGNAESVALGRPVEALVGRRSMVALSAAERFRRSVAAIIRNTKSLKTRATPHLKGKLTTPHGDIE